MLQMTRRDSNYIPGDSELENVTDSEDEHELAVSTPREDVPVNENSMIIPYQPFHSDSRQAPTFQNFR